MARTIRALFIHLLLKHILVIMLRYVLTSPLGHIVFFNCNGIVLHCYGLKDESVGTITPKCMIILFE